MPYAADLPVIKFPPEIKVTKVSSVVLGDSVTCETTVKSLHHKSDRQERW